MTSTLNINNSSNSNAFGLLSRLIPVYRGEWLNFLMLAMMMVLIVFEYSILRVTKDSLVLSTSGAELLSALKLYVTFPMAAIFVALYAKLTQIFTRMKIFHILNFSFAIIFTIYAFFLHDNLNAICFDLSDLKLQYPYLKYILRVLETWPISLFYVASELYGSIMMGLMFWQIANQINTTEQSKRIYPLIGCLAQLGLFLCGLYSSSKGFAEEATAVIEGSNEYWSSIIREIGIVTLSCAILVSFVFNRLASHVGVDTINITKSKSGNNKKVKMGFIDSILYVFSSKYIGLLAGMVICYGVSINLVEALWKKYAQIEMQTPERVFGYMGYVQQYTAVVAAIGGLAGSHLGKILSWRILALITPIVIFITGMPFFISSIYASSLEGYIFSYLGMKAVTFTLFTGAVQNVLSKGVKYPIFDPAKETAYIPLDDDLKSKGKAAVDVVGSRLGKSLGAIIQQLLLMIYITEAASVTLFDLAGTISCIFIVIIGFWFVAVFLLAKEFNKLSKTS